MRLPIKGGKPANRLNHQRAIGKEIVCGKDHDDEPNSGLAEELRGADGHRREKLPHVFRDVRLDFLSIHGDAEPIAKIRNFSNRPFGQLATSAGTTSLADSFLADSSGADFSTALW